MTSELQKIKKAKTLKLSERWYARIKMDDGTWYRVATKKIELETAKSRALELYYEATIKGKNNLPQNTRSFSSIAKSIVKKLESTRETMQWKQTYQAYIYAINKIPNPPTFDTAS